MWIVLMVVLLFRINYANASDTTECGAACLDCNDQSRCLKCFDNFYITESGQCEQCPSGMFYSEEFDECQQCRDSCKSSCKYQEHCFDCVQGYYFDLATHECVEQCDEGKIQTDSYIFSGRRLCRPLQYYVDPKSTNIIELGTKAYPYKDLGFVFVEILNLHSHTDRNITVYLKENTVSEVMVQNSHIVNITQVNMMSYSDDSLNEVGRATILGLDKGKLSYKENTFFNVLKNLTNDMKGMIYNIPEITTTEKNRLGTNEYLFMIQRSSFLFQDIICLTDYVEYNTNNIFLFTMYIQAKQVTLKNIHFEIQGANFVTYDPLNLYMENIMVDYYKNYFGFKMDIECNYPEADLYGLVYVDGIKFYYSQERLVNPTVENAFTYTGPGDWIVNNYTNHIWSFTNEPRKQLSLNLETPCMPDIDKIMYHNVSNAEITLKDDSGNSVAFIGAQLENEIYRETQIFYTNITTHDCWNNLYPSIYIYGNMASTFTLDGSSIVSCSSVRQLELYEKFRTINMYNIYMENVNLNGKYGIQITLTNEVNLRNVTYNNLNFSHTFDHSILYAGTIDDNILTVDNLLVKNSVLGYRTLLHHASTGAGSFTINNVMFQDVKVKEFASLVKASSTRNFLASNFYLQNVGQVNTRDKSNSVIDLVSIDANSTGTFSITNTTITQSTIPFFKINGGINTQNNDQKLTISGLTYCDSVIPYEQDLVKIGELETNNNFRIEIDDVEMRNLTFTRRGILLKFQQQLASPLVLKNSRFSDIYEGHIYIGSANLQNSKMKTHVEFSNLTISDIQNNKVAFITNYEGGVAIIQDSKFNRVRSGNRGSVINGAYRNSVTEIYRSTFRNNYSIEGGVAKVQDGSVIRFYDCNLTYNFAILSGVIRSTDDGYYEIYRSIISDNYALSASISEIFIAGTTSRINNCTIYDNYVISADEFASQLDSCTILCFLDQETIDFSKAFFNTLIQTTDYFNFRSVSGTLIIENSTTITSQDNILSSYLSDIRVSNCYLSNIQTQDSVFSVADSNFIIENTSIENMKSLKVATFVKASLYSTVLVLNSSYKDSALRFMLVVSANLDIVNTSISEISLNSNLLSYTKSSSSSISNSTIINVSTTDSSLISVSSSVISNISSLVIEQTNTIVLLSHFSTFDHVNMLSIINAARGCVFDTCEINLIENSIFEDLGSSDIMGGGAIHSIDTNFTISATRFSDNIAQKGGAISIECEDYNRCNTSISKSIFSNNSAAQQGGAINYDFRKPKLQSIIFNQNTARYGGNIASYAVRIALCDSLDQPIYLYNVVSGIEYNDKLELCLVDYDGQRMISDSYSTLKIVPVTVNATVSGRDSAPVINGKAVIHNITFEYMPGAANVEFMATTRSLDKDKIAFLDLPTNDTITISFRYCAPGEIIQDNRRCVECSPLTYSLIWNATVCHPCFADVRCRGTIEIDVYDGFWRENLNSTDIMLCPNTEACEGGFHPENKHPVKCKDGYTGYLCSQCDFNGNEKYEKISEYECSQCPDPILNGIRFCALLIFAFGFMFLLIGTTIRKTKENQVSILLRIFANYIQLVSAALSFGFRLPNVLAAISGPLKRLGSFSDTILSFDCFIDQNQLKLFSPSNEIFKVFLIVIMPAVLIFLISVIWILLYFTFRKHFSDVKRYIVITIVCVLFLMHPTLTRATFGMFECESISSTIRKMKLNLDYECFSNDHWFWIGAVALPSLIVWVIGSPIAAFVVLFMNRNNLNSETMKRNFFLLYQGLKEEAFYWEIVNSVRKMIVLVFSTVISVLSIYYSTLTTIAVMYLLTKIQQRIQPYEYDRNNRLEMRAITAGSLALYCGLLFESDNEHNYTGLLVIAILILMVVNILFLAEWLYMFIQAFDFKNHTKDVILQILASLLFERHEIFVRNQKESEKESEEDDHSSELNNRDISPTYKRLLKFCKKQRNKKHKKKEIHNRRVVPLRQASDVKRLYIDKRRRDRMSNKLVPQLRFAELNKENNPKRRREFLSKFSLSMPKLDNFSSMAAFQLSSGLNAKNSKLECMKEEEQKDEMSSIDLIELKLN